MGKILRAIGAVIGFTALAMAAIFFAETGTFFNLSASPAALTADIGNVVNVGAATQQVNSIDSVSSPAVSDAQTAPAATASSGSETLANGQTAAADASATATAETEAPSQTAPQDSQSIIPSPPLLEPTAAADSPQTSTVSTATITVSPTAPLPPLPPAGSFESNGSGPSSPYTQTNFTGDANWQATWGTINITQLGFLDLSAQSDSTGGAVYLKSSNGWANYTFSATIDWVAGHSFALLADYRDASDYVFCDYENSGAGSVSVQLKDYEHGSESNLSPLTSMSWDNATSNIPVSISVNGFYGTCSFENQSITNSGAGQGRTAMSSPETGGIGFSINDTSAGTASIIVRSVRVAGN